MCGPACVLALLALAAWAGDARPIEILRPDAASLPTAPLPGHSQAFVTLLYNDDFVNGLRVLGQSLRETRTERDLVAIVAGNVSSVAIATLVTDGFKVLRSQTVANPGLWSQGNVHGSKFPARFWGVYTKLLIFNMTQYERVVYLDADTIAMRNIDELFLCDGFCAVLRHSERLNSGTMVLQPDAALFKQMMAAMHSTPSYTGGDQGFLNAFFSEFASAPLFDPTKGKLLSAAAEGGRAQHAVELGRLPTQYNADLGLYVLNSNRWTLPEDTIGVLHYTLATFKPWDWWSTWLLGGNARLWQQLRQRLPPAADGRYHGESAQEQLVRILGLPMPCLLLVLLVRQCWDQGLRTCLRCMCCNIRAAAPRSRHARRLSEPLDAPPMPLAVVLPLGFATAATISGLLCVGGALGISVKVLIPRQIQPRVGWILAYEWTAVLLLMSFAQYLRLCHAWGQRSAARWQGLLASDDDKAKPFFCGSRPWIETLVLLTALLVTLGLLPWWCDFYGVRSFAGKVLCTGAAGAASMIVCSQCFVGLGAVWYRCGVLTGPCHPAPGVKV